MRDEDWAMAWADGAVSSHKGGCLAAHGGDRLYWGEESG